MATIHFPRTVDLSFFDRKSPVVHKQVSVIVIRKIELENQEECLLGFIPHSEVYYKFHGFIPDVMFQKLPIDHVYYEPYRTFLYLKKATDIVLKSDPDKGKLYVESARKDKKTYTI